MRRWVILVLTLVLCMIPAAALDGETVPGWDGLWDQAEDYGVSQDTGLEGGLSQLVVQGLEQLKALAGRSIATGVKLLAVVLVCGLAQSAALPGQQEGVQAAELAGALAITALTMTDVAAMIGLGRETLRRMDDFAQALLPVMAALTAATGRVSGAAVGQGVTVLFSQLLLDAMDGLLIPLIDGYVAVSCAWAAVDSPGLKKLGELMKGAAALILTGLLLAFVGYLTASGAIAGSVDAAAVKTAKLAISRAIPVVGGILADASETVLAGAGVLRGTVGTAGMLVVLAICLTPFLHLGLHYLVYKAAAALCALIAQPRLSGLIDALGGAFGMVLGMTGAGALVLLVSVASALTAVGGG